MNPKTKQLPRLIFSALLAAMFIPGISMAAEVSRTAFDAAVFKDAVAQVTQGASLTESKQISIRTQPLTEAADKTRVAVVTSLPGVEQIVIFSETNPRPLLANYRLPKDTVSEVGAMVKIQKDTNIVAVVKADGKFYTAKFPVKVPTPGCGG